MDVNATRQSSTESQKAQWRVLRALVALAVLPLPLVAYALSVYVVGRGGTNGHTQELLSRQILLVCGALFVSGVGGFLIWNTATSLARTTEVETQLEHLDHALTGRLDESGPLMNSFTRMLTTIERQTDDINQFAQRLDAAYRELESAHARLQEVTFTDDVTHLYNRRYFSIRLEQEVGRHRRFGHPVSIVLIDLDGFKAINDGLGHLAGDDTLRGVADVLLKNSRAIDVICRYGGDEFAVLLAETPRSGAEPYAERIREILRAHSFSDGRQVTASFGVASLPDDVSSTDEMIRAADEALYAAKRAGKNRVATYHAAGAEWAASVVA